MSLDDDIALVASIRSTGDRSPVVDAIGRILEELRQATGWRASAQMEASAKGLAWKLAEQEVDLLRKERDALKAEVERWHRITNEEEAARHAAEDERDRAGTEAEALRARVAELEKRPKDSVLRTFATGVVQATEALTRAESRIATLEAALQEIVLFGTDCPAAMSGDEASFYRQQIYSAIRRARTALEVLREPSICRLQGCRFHADHDGPHELQPKETPTT